jgi:CheY-like chemotaxis protein
MGGDCGVTSQLGEGSTFWFTTRTSAVRKPEAGGQERPGPNPTTPSHSQKVGALASRRLLLAEDNLVNQKVVLAMLSESGCQIDIVANGAEAIRAARGHTYDAILMDCQMPELNGFEATTSIRANELDSNRRTPIIAVTAGARPEDRERCLLGGMDECLTKPLRRDVLLATVDRLTTRAPDGSDRSGDVIDHALASGRGGA